MHRLAGQGAVVLLELHRVYVRPRCHRFCRHYILAFAIWIAGVSCCHPEGPDLGFQRHKPRHLVGVLQSRQLSERR